MVPPESFSTEAPHSSSAFCNGCDGGTQCESLSSKVLSWASVGGRRADQGGESGRAEAGGQAGQHGIPPRFKCWSRGQLFYYSAACRGRCKGYSLISNYVPDRRFSAVARGRKWRG